MTNYIEEVKRTALRDIIQMTSLADEEADTLEDIIDTLASEVDRRAREEYQPIIATRIQNIEGRAYATFEVPNVEESHFFVKIIHPR